MSKKVLKGRIKLIGLLKETKQRLTKLQTTSKIIVRLIDDASSQIEQLIDFIENME